MLFTQDAKRMKRNNNEDLTGWLEVIKIIKLGVVVE